MTQIKLRRDTAANFTSKNPVLGMGEPAYETDTKKLKIGDGATAYTQLKYFSTGGSGLEVCDIGMALYIDETKGLRRYLNGQIVDINTNTQAFLNRLKQITTLHPSLLCTEDEWQTAKTMSAFGQVGKFVFNYSGDEIVSVRLPRVVNVQGLFDLQNLGMTVAESLPNIKGNTGDVVGDHGGASGAFYVSGNGKAGFNGGYVVWRKLGFDASRSSSAYQDNAPVQQEAIQYPYFIQIATGAETEANIVNTLENVNGFTLLESKYSDKPLYNESWLLSNGQQNAKAVYLTAYEGLQVEYNSEIEAGTTVTLPSGVSYTKRGLSVKLSTETYTDYDFVLNTAEETFRLPLKTKLASGKAVVGNGMTLGLTNGTQLLGAGTRSQYSSSNQAIISLSTTDYGKNVGQANTLNTSTVGTTIGVTTDPTKSGIELSDSGLYLYFYVGETVQNANLIDAGRIGEQLANKQDKLSRYPIEISDKSLMPSWYVVYNDGWCEQGGKSLGTGAITINLLKTFTNTNYTASASLIGTDGAYLARADATLSTFTPSSFKIDYKTINTEGIGTAVGYFWQVSGYIR